MELSPIEFDLFQHYIAQICGIYLTPDKQYLLKQRLQPMLSDLKCRTFSELYQKIQHSEGSSRGENLINAITTNETSFFRDRKVFELFYDYLLDYFISSIPVPQEGGGKKIKIWSAASSTGEEPYSLGILIREYQRNHPSLTFNCDILATDISSRVLRQAASGYFSSFQLQRGMETRWQNCYFKPEGKKWRIVEHVRELIRFQAFNLLKIKENQEKFHLIFCRNVLIYFRPEVRYLVLKGIYDALYPQGVLVLGTTENLYGIDLPFQKEVHGNSLMYRKVAEKK